MNRSQVGVLKERNKVRLSGFLKRHNSRRLETEISLSNKVSQLERQGRIQKKTITLKS